MKVQRTQLGGKQLGFGWLYVVSSDRGLLRPSSMIFESGKLMMDGQRPSEIEGGVE